MNKIAKRTWAALALAGVLLLGLLIIVVRYMVDSPDWVTFQIDDFFSLFDEPTADDTPKDRSEAGSPDPFTPEDYGVHSGFAEPDESGADLSRTGIYDRKNFTGGYSNGHDYDRDWRDDE